MASAVPSEPPITKLGFSPRGNASPVITVFVGTSLDGFIARKDGALDFLPADGGEPHGYTELMASVDALVIGRNTFAIVLKFPEWPYVKKRVVVLSSRPLDMSSAIGGIVEQMSGSAIEIVARARTTPHKLNTTVCYSHYFYFFRWGVCCWPGWLSRVFPSLLEMEFRS